MRPPIRLLNHTETPLKSLYLCTSCRKATRPLQPLPRLTTIHQTQTRLNTSGPNPLSFTERIRRKIWGTDRPPGAEDPYGGEGALARTWREKWAKKKSTPEEEREAEVAARAAEEEEDRGDLDDYEDPEYGEIAPPAEYVAATTWDGLERVGHLGRWSDFPPTEVDEGYNPFKPSAKLTKMMYLLPAAHQAAVEIALLRSLDKRLTKICHVVEHHREILRFLRRTRFEQPRWENAVVFPSPQSKKALLYVFDQIGDYTRREAASAGDAYEDKNKHGNVAAKLSFKNNYFLGLPLDNPAIRFAFLKRFSQLTGHFFPDSVAHTFGKISHVLKHLDKTVVRAKPRKLTRELITSSPVNSMPNVKILTTRQTQALRDHELGRGKVIERELRARGLFE